MVSNSNSADDVLSEPCIRQSVDEVVQMKTFAIQGTVVQRGRAANGWYYKITGRVQSGMERRLEKQAEALEAGL